MNSGVKGIASHATRTIAKRSPEIFSVLWIAGMIMTVGMAVGATPKALSCIEEKKTELGTDRLTKTEIVRATWRVYLPSAIMGMASILCMVCSSSTNYRRNAALGAAYTLSESTLKAYRERVAEEIGETKEREIRKKVTSETIAKDPVREVILTKRGGETICYDPMSGRYFKSDREFIVRVVNELNRRMRYEMYISLNDFYYEIGLDNVDAGEILGWCIDKGYIDIDFDSRLDANGTPCLVIMYENPPVYDYM